MNPQREPWAQGFPGWYVLPTDRDAGLDQDRSRLQETLLVGADTKTKTDASAYWSCLECRAPQGSSAGAQRQGRDVPRQSFFHAQQWRKHYRASLVSLQPDGHEETEVNSLIKKDT